MTRTLKAPELRTPYPGLRPFRRYEAQVFFGREDQVEDLLGRLADARLVAVAGESGCGKSSLIRAGLIPAIEAGFMPTGTVNQWRILEMRPEDRPFRNLGEAYLKAQGDSAQPSQEDIAFLAARLRRGPLGLVELFNDRPLPVGSEFLLLIDQFEELIRFRDRAPNDEASAFVELLLETITHPNLPIRVVLTLRTDYLGKSAVFRGLPEALNRSQYLTPLLDRDQLHEAIVGPARLFDGDVDPVLANHMINEIGRGQDQLPVLQHALMWMWTRARDRITASSAPIDAAGPPSDPTASIRGAVPEGDHSITLTMSDYEEVGGLGAALSKHADEAYDQLNEPGRQFVAKKMFCALWDNDAKGVDNRRPCRLDRVATIAGTSDDEVAAVAGVFRAPEHSFIMPLAGDTPLEIDTVLDVSHESLFRHWTRLQLWIQEEKRDIEELDNLSHLANEWHARRGDLLPDKNLRAAREWLERASPTPAWAAHNASGSADFSLTTQFLEASEQEAIVRSSFQKWHRVRLAVISLLFLCSLAIVVVTTALNAARNREGRAAAQNATKERFTAAASNAASAEPVRGLQLALEAASRDPVSLSPNGAMALRTALRRSHFRSLVVASTGYFDSAEFLPADRLVTVGRGDGVAVWDYRSGTRQWAAFGSESRPSLLAVDSSGRVIASAGTAGSIDLWDADTGRVIKTLKAHVDAVKSLSFSPDGKLLVSTSADSSAKIWDVHGGLELWSLVDHLGTVDGASFSHDSQRVVTTGADGRLVLWDVASGKKLRTFFSDNSTVIQRVAFNVSGGILAGSHGRDIFLWDPLNGHLAGTLAHTAQVGAFVFSPDGRRLASVGGSLKLWDVGTHNALFEAFEEPALNPSGRATGVGKGPNGNANDPLAGGAWLYSVAFSPDGRSLVTTGLDGTAKVWAVTEGGETGGIVAHEAGIERIAFGPDGKTVATGSLDGTAAVWDRVDGHLIFRTPRRSRVEVVAFDATGSRLAVSDGRHMTSWDTASYKTVGGPLSLGPPGTIVDEENDGTSDPLFIWDAKFFHHHEHLVATAENAIVVWDVVSNRELFRRDVGVKVLAVAVSPDDTLIATECRDQNDGCDNHDHEVCLWDGSSGKRVKIFGCGTPANSTVRAGKSAGARAATGGAHLLPVTDLAFSPDGRMLVSSSEDKLVKVWDIERGTLAATLNGHHTRVLALAISPDSHSLATAGEDWVRLWDLDSHVPKEGFPDAAWGAASVAFSPDGQELAAGGVDGVVRLYATDSRALVPLAETRVPVAPTDAECRRYAGDACARKPTPLQLGVAGRLALRSGERQVGRGLLALAAKAAPEAGFDRGLARFESAEAINATHNGILQALDRSIEKFNEETTSTDPVANRTRLLTLIGEATRNEVIRGGRELEKIGRVDPGIRFSPSLLANSIVDSQVLAYAHSLGLAGGSAFLTAVLKLRFAERSEPGLAEREASTLAVVEAIRKAGAALERKEYRNAADTIAAERVSPADPHFTGWLRLAVRVGAARPQGGEHASKLGRDVLATNNNDPDLLIALGNCLTGARDFGAANEAFRRALVQQPSNDIARFYMGDSLAKAGKYSKAVEILRGIPPTAPTYRVAAGLAGSIVFDHLGDREAGYMMMAAATDGRGPDNWANLAEAALATGRFLEARLISERVLAARDVDPASAEVVLAMHFVLTAALVQGGDLGAVRSELNSIWAAVQTVRKQNWNYTGSRAAATRIKDMTQRNFVERLLDYVETLGRRGQPEELRSLLNRAAAERSGGIASASGRGNDGGSHRP